jgi:hypothetical protein
VAVAATAQDDPRDAAAPRCGALLARIAPWAGLIGAIAISCGSILAALVYRGTEGESWLRTPEGVA